MSNTPETPEVPEVLEEQTPPQAQEQTARRSSQQQRKRQRSVVFYIAILFAAAFLLLALSFAMERRQNAEDMNDLNQSLSGLKDSVSAMQSVQELYEENAELLQEVDRLKERIYILEEEQQLLIENIEVMSTDKETQQKQIQAMDWFWQINEAYVRNRWDTARALVNELEAAGLKDYLPEVSITDNGRFSPADRYEEICEDLF